MCTYNGSQFVEKQIESIFTQNVLPKSIFVIDDGSSDNTIEVVKNTFKHFNYFNFYIVNTTRNGTKNNFLSFLKLCNADYIFFSDQDDIWLPNKIEIFSKKILENYDSEKPQLYFSDCNLLLNDVVKNQTFFSYQGLSHNFFDDDSILYRNCVQGASSCINRKMLELILESLKFVEIDNLYMHDWWIALLAKYYGEAIFIPEPTLLYRQHANNQIGIYHKKARFFHIIKKFRKFYSNFKLAISQVAELEKLVLFIPTSTLSKNKLRKYSHVHVIKKFILRILNL